MAEIKTRTKAPELEKFFTCEACGREVVIHSSYEARQALEGICASCESERSRMASTEKWSAVYVGSVVVAVETEGMTSHPSALVIRRPDGSRMRVFADPDYDGGAELSIEREE